MSSETPASSAAIQPPLPAVREPVPTSSPVPSAVPTPDPAPNDRDKATMALAKRRVLGRRKRLSVKATATGLDVAIEAPHSDATGHQYLALDTFGTASVDFMTTALGQILDAIRDTGVAPKEQVINAALAIVGGVQPENEVQALLASQMAATHTLGMTMAGRARRSSDPDEMRASGGLAVKLFRTFALQAEALDKIKRGGNQTMRVEHVHVHAGGQAIVGQVTPGAGSEEKIGGQARDCETLAIAHSDAAISPVRSAHAPRDTLPMPSDA